MATGDTVPIPSSPPGFVVLFGCFFFSSTSLRPTFSTLPSLAFVVAVRSFFHLDIAGGSFLISLVPFCLARIQ
ncbi:hypothetical protein N7497_000447 [Penicillium chrysogenum]|uniref:Uncharacterized protein n=1 Tax=Penicillium chrysogenum TaxID=5076 RepID=A0ABQ8WZY5_PENCH|nr:hypothetical protein N7505_002251 [Penicillium chrysogenum]KAJ6167604.1 hypothetical protein N7497_000447 [Penicillium chrysogenum]